MINRRGVVVTKLTPGGFVRHPERPDWSVGQVQSVIGARVTVSFEHAGKLLIDSNRISLETIDDDGSQPPRSSKNG
jgi:hypothetical protein